MINGVYFEQKRRLLKSKRRFKIQYYVNAVYSFHSKIHMTLRQIDPDTTANIIGRIS